jgi:diguanylate cyclase (GGDEF)-like protein
MTTSAQTTPSRAERSTAGVIAVLLVLAAIVTLPGGSRPLPAVNAFLPIYLTLAATGDALTAFLLFVQFRAAGSRPLALLAVAYTFTAVIAVAQACSFPGLFSTTGLFGTQSQTSVWLWAIWHGGFPLIVTLYAIGRRTTSDTYQQRPVVEVVAVFTGGLALGLGLSAFAYMAKLPVLVQGMSYVGGFSGTWQTVLGLAVLGLVAMIVLTRLATVLDLWLAVVLVGGLCDATLTIFAHQRYSVGWYLSRVYAVITSLTVALVFLAELSRLYHRFSRLASVDALTGLANRRTFDERIDEAHRAAARSGEPYALLMIDVDDFKRFNDSYGHVAGDATLRTIAAAIVAVVHRPRDVVARFGGEEFAVILPATTHDAGAVVADRIRNEVLARRIPHRANRAGPFVTVSLGVGSSDSADAHTTVVVERADAALYRAKDAGRNRVAG